MLVITPMKWAEFMKTDTQLRHDVEHELEWDPSVDAGHIGGTASDGVITLTGEVNTYAERWNAERATERVAGVCAVANEIEIRTDGEHNDTDIAKAAVDSFLWNAALPRGRVMVQVSKGWVTMSGELTTDYLRRSAEKSVRYLRGVTGVTDLITVKPNVEAKDLKRKIDDSIKRHAALDAERIVVNVDDGEVTLGGTVRSWAERHDAERTAWAGPGVRSVTNDLKVSLVD
jgi:osmotically-inducible protein OsmY